MLPDRVSNPGPLTYESGALPIALRGPASYKRVKQISCTQHKTSAKKYSAKNNLITEAESIHQSISFLNMFSRQEGLKALNRSPE